MWSKCEPCGFLGEEHSRLQNSRDGILTNAMTGEHDIYRKNKCGWSTLNEEDSSYERKSDQESFKCPWDDFDFYFVKRKSQQKHLSPAVR